VPGGEARQGVSSGRQSTVRGPRILGPEAGRELYVHDSRFRLEAFVLL
jgi:hypothetical protein